MKRCKAEYLLIKMTLLKYLIYKGCTFYLRLFRLAEKMFTMHTLHAFGWMFFYHLEGCDFINFIDKKSLTLYCLITWNDNYALLIKNLLLYIVLLLGMIIMHLLILLTKNLLLYIVLLLGMIIMHYWSYIIVGNAKAAVQPSLITQTQPWIT